MNELDSWNQERREEECRKLQDCEGCQYRLRCEDAELTNDMEEI